MLIRMCGYFLDICYIILKLRKGFFFFFLLMFGLSWRSVRIKINNLFTHLIFLYLAFGTVRYAGWNLDLHICCYFEGN